MDDSAKLMTNYRALNILQSSFAGGVLLYGMIVFVLSRHDQKAPDWSDPLVLVLGVFTAVLVPLALFLSNRSLPAIKAEEDLDQKIVLYRAAFIRRAAMLEGAMLFSIVVVFLTHCFSYYVFTAISFAAFMSQWITLDKMRRDLDI